MTQGKPSSKLIAKRLVVRMKEEGAKSFLSQQDNLAKIVEDLVRFQVTVVNLVN